MKCAVLLSVLSQVFAQMIYQCAPDDVQWNSGLGCIKLDPSSTADKTIYDIRLCTDNVNTYCPSDKLPAAQGQEILCTTPSTATEKLAAPATTYPGDPCNVNTDCLSGTCTMGYCVGTPQGQGCQQDSDCNPGNYCDATNTKQCAALLAAGDACDQDVMCGMNMGCNNKVCTVYFSVADNGSVTDCGNNGYPLFPIAGSAGISYSVFCQSGVCNSDGKTCSATLISTGQIPVSCTAQQANCNTKSSTGVTGTTNCMQGKNNAGSMYCAAEQGDAPYLNFMSWFTETYLTLVATNGAVCSTLHRHLETVCLKMLGGQYLINQWTMYYNNAKNYAVYVKSDECTQQVIEPEVYNPTQWNNFCDTTFSCATNSTAFNTAQGCILQNSADKTFTVRPCTDVFLSYCPNVHYYHLLNPMEVTCYQETTSPAAATGNLPGDLCANHYQCLSNTCTNAKCVGAASGEDCDVDSDCDVGLYCETTGATSQCQPLIAVGKACTASQQCVMNAGCNFADGNTGTCVAYYSVAVANPPNLVSDCGVATFLPSGSSIIQGTGYMVKYSAFCASGTCELTNGGNNVGECVGSYHQTGTLPTTCKFLKTDCASTNGDGVGSTYTSCGCGRASSSRYCSLDLGDQPFVDLMTWTQTYIGNTTSCHTLRRGLDPICMQNNDKGGMYTTMQFNERYYLATHYQIIAEAANCTQQVYMPEYWSAVQYNRAYSSQQNPPEYSASLYGFALTALVLVLS